MEKVVPNIEIRKNPGSTSITNAEAIVPAPYGCHPYFSPGFYVQDKSHVKEYVEAASHFAKEGKREILDEIFKPFFTTKSKGTGLGLVNVRKIIEGHGGTISIENKAECGIKIVMRLPVE